MNYPQTYFHRQDHQNDERIIPLLFLAAAPAFYGGMDFAVRGMVMADLGTGTAADRGTDLAAVHGMVSVVAPGMAGHGGNCKIKRAPRWPGSFSLSMKKFILL
ncbi:hypothetical protein [Bacillus sp. ISL-45]|uniref:hypothetical protein n=1 Tax=Bacillus sp. ISL-45 TaxID=2819128 RepID=UPI001BE974B5|nr:hypothetical protein [Bacillus sp. ISL-45]MBT2661203.1 hypothetical protein [Bacillus sp. ISL-45]